MKDATPASDTRLPVEPSRPFPADALKEAAKRRAGSLSPYQMSSSDFDIAFITPVMIYAAQSQFEQQMSARGRGGAGRPDPGQAFIRPLLDFGNWSEYVADVHPVLLVRVTPKLVEGFWTKVARGAAQTQGVSLPPFKRIRSGFSRMRAYCGDTEVTPIHPLQDRTASLGHGNDLRRLVGLRPRCACALVRNRQADAVFRERAPEARHANRRCESSPADLGRLRPCTGPSRICPIFGRRTNGHLQFSAQRPSRVRRFLGPEPAAALCSARPLGLHGPKFGCGLGQCGACTVLVDEQATRSCTLPVSRAAGRAITTLEGLGTPEKPDPVQAAFVAEQAAQCGYCTNGMIMAATALLSAHAEADAGSGQAGPRRQPVPLRHAHADHARGHARVAGIGGQP